MWIVLRLRYCDPKCMLTRKPRLLLFAHVSNSGSITGAEKLLLLFCSYMAPYYECIMVAPQEGILTAHARAQGTLVLIQQFPLLYTMYDPDAQLSQKAQELLLHPDYQSVLRLIAEYAPNLVLTNTVVNVLPAMAAKSLNIPVVWKITEVMHVNQYTPDAVHFIDQYSDWVLAISGAAGSMLEGHISSPISYLSPSADHTRFHPSSRAVRRKQRKEFFLKDSEYCIGYISAFIHPEKGLREFVNMALSLCVIHPKCRFLIIGRPADLAYYDSCKLEVKCSPYKGRFQWVSYVESVQKVYSAMDIVVIPSMVAEGFGMTAFEGMLCGKPVVAFATGGLGEMMVQTGNSHLVATPGDFAALASKVTELMHNPATLKAVGEHNALVARELYGIEAYTEKLRNLMDRWKLHDPSWFEPKPQSPMYTELPQIIDGPIPRRKQKTRKISSRLIQHSKKRSGRRAKRSRTTMATLTRGRHKRKLDKARSSSKYRKHG